MRCVWAVAGVIPAIAVAVAMSGGAADLEVDEIMRRNVAVGKVTDSRAEVTITLSGAGGSRRERSTFSLTKLLPNGSDQKRLVRFLAPADVKGTATLLVEHADADDDIWIYLPALHKVRRLVASNTKDSFVGTDFSYGDVIGHKVEDWTHQLVGTETVDGAPAYVIESLPRSDEVRRNSGYSKRRGWVRQDNFVLVRSTYWDTGGALLKEMRASDVREVDPAHHKWQAFSVTMENRQTGHATEFRWTKLEVGVGLDDEQFTERYLEKES